MLFNHLLIGLAGGALAFVHCLGMCGGFVLQVSGSGSSLRMLGRQGLWLAGKTCSYAFMGALAGFGGALVQASARLATLQTVFSYAVGGVMILMGLVLLGMPVRIWRRPAGDEEGLFVSVFRIFSRQSGLAGALALGLANGFLPCPVVYAFLAYAAQTGSVAAGMATMVGLGLGTAWSLILLGMTGHLIGLWLRRWGSLFAGIILVVWGLATVLRGTEAFHRLLGCPEQGQHEAAGCRCAEK